VRWGPVGGGVGGAVGSGGGTPMGRNGGVGGGGVRVSEHGGSFSSSPSSPSSLSPGRKATVSFSPQADPPSSLRPPSPVRFTLPDDTHTSPYPSPYPTQDNPLNSQPTPTHPLDPSDPSDPSDNLRPRTVPDYPTHRPDTVDPVNKRYMLGVRYQGTEYCRLMRPQAPASATATAAGGASASGSMQIDRQASMRGRNNKKSTGGGGGEGGGGGGGGGYKKKPKRNLVTAATFAKKGGAFTPYSMKKEGPKGQDEMSVFEAGGMELLITEVKTSPVEVCVYEVDEGLRVVHQYAGSVLLNTCREERVVVACADPYGRVVDVRLVLGWGDRSHDAEVRWVGDDGDDMMDDGSG
jgi:hypothetical protein